MFSVFAALRDYYKDLEEKNGDWLKLKEIRSNGLKVVCVLGVGDKLDNRK